jgi:hypothetical protein
VPLLPWPWLLDHACLTLRYGSGCLQAYTSRAWNATRIVAASEIATALVTNATLRDAFLWTSHTFTHQNLNNATYTDCRWVGGLEHHQLQHSAQLSTCVGVWSIQRPVMMHGLWAAAARHVQDGWQVFSTAGANSK